jgi:hypothetical protein
MRTTALAAFLTAFVTSPSMACEIDTPSDWLPGFTKEQQEDRSAKILNARSDILMYIRIEAHMKDAPVVYLARVLQSEDFQMNKFLYHASIKPLKALKGEMPKKRQLTSANQNSCGWADGDGDATFARPGELVVIFEGLPIRKERPRGVDSVRLIEVTYGSLLDPIQEWLATQPGYPGPL